VAFTPGGRLLAVTVDGPLLGVWDALAGRRVLEIASDGRPPREVALSANARWLVAGSSDGVVRCWSIASEARLVAVLRHRRAVTAVAISNDGRYVAFAGGVHLRVALRTGEIVGETRAGAAMAFWGPEVLVGDVQGRVMQWDPLSNDVANLADLDGTLRALALTADGGALAAAAEDGTVWLRRLAAPVHQRTESGKVATRWLSSSQRLFDWLRRVALL
jgi:WD40 repeat protein